MTSPKHFLLRLAALHLPTSHDAGHGVLRKRDRQLSLYDIAATIARRQIVTGDVRKDLRRPRFSFFRFNCQTAIPDALNLPQKRTCPADLQY
ncbi:MAG: hypothetical protein AB7F96_17075 [Beijerinckiaceae bacterium]